MPRSADPHAQPVVTGFFPKWLTLLVACGAVAGYAWRAQPVRASASPAALELAGVVLLVSLAAAGLLQVLQAPATGAGQRAGKARRNAMRIAGHKTRSAASHERVRFMGRS